MCLPRGLPTAREPPAEAASHACSAGVHRGHPQACLPAHSAELSGTCMGVAVSLGGLREGSGGPEATCTLLTHEYRSNLTGAGVMARS